MAKRKKATTHHYKKSDASLMLLAAAAAILVGFFAIFAYKSGNTIPLPTPTPSAATVALSALNQSGENGTATLQEVNGKVVVTLNATGELAGASEPAHIHTGSCPNPGAVKYPLTNVVNGTSVTTLDVTLAQLKAMEPLAINVHKSVSQINWYVSCGDLKL